MEGRLLLDVVVGQGTAILELLACENQALLVRRNALLVLNLRLDVVDGVGRLHLEGDGLSSKGLDDCVLSAAGSADLVGIFKHTDLHTATEAEDEVERGLLLNVVIRQGAAILELLASENQALLVRRNALLVLNLRLDIVDSVGRLHLEGDGLAGDCMPS